VAGLGAPLALTYREKCGGSSDEPHTLRTVKRREGYVIRRHTWTTAVLLVTMSTLVATGAALAARAETVKLSAKMDARQVVPDKPKGNVARASGTFTGTLTGRSSVARWKLSWRLTYRNLDRPRIVVADIHYGKRGKFGPVIVRLCGPCKSGQKGVVKVKSSWVDAIKAGSAFITLITGKNPNGEIRGQIRAGGAT
jgi:CHRD domain